LSLGAYKIMYDSPMVFCTGTCNILTNSILTVLLSVQRHLRFLLPVQTKVSINLPIVSRRQTIAHTIYSHLCVS